MRGSTNVHIAVRNIGDSQDLGEFYEGPLKGGILWLASHLAKVHMATRLVMGIGRNREDAARGIDVARAGRAAITDDMKEVLDSMFDALDDSDLPSDQSHTATKASVIARDPQDDYEA